MNILKRVMNRLRKEDRVPDHHVPLIGPVPPCQEGWPVTNPLKEVMGKWPGEESIEEILTALDDGTNIDIRYDPETDAIAISFGDIKWEETIDITEDIFVDVDRDGRLAGIEILHASTKTYLRAFISAIKEDGE